MIPQVMSIGPEDPEARIHAAWKRADYRQAVTLLIQAYGAEIRAFLANKVGSRSRADDVYSTFLENVNDGLSQFRWECRAKAYAYLLARYAACRYLKAERRYQHLTDEHLRDLPAEHHSRTASYLKTDFKSRVQAIRDRLSEEDQELLLLHVSRQLTFREIAATYLENGLHSDAGDLSREENRLRSQFRWTKARLKKLAAEEGLL